jgi:hypothetical protein
MFPEGVRGKDGSLPGGVAGGKEVSCEIGKHLIIVPIPAVFPGGILREYALYDRAVPAATYAPV